MQRAIQNGGVALAGLATSILTAIAVSIFDQLTGFNFFSFSIWVFVPAGAGLCGFAAASGYYFAAKFLHQQPSKWLLFQMVAIAACTQVLIYWLEYQNLVIEDRHVSDFVSFSQYLDVTLTKAHMRLGRGMHDTGEVGSFGYWLAVIDFFGFMIGGVFVYLKLKDDLACDNCKKYLRSVRRKSDSFPDFESFAEYFDAVYANPIDGPEFASHIGTEHSAGKAQVGSINLTTRVYECPGCLEQSIRETAQVFGGKEWKDVPEWTRYVGVPKGVDVRGYFAP